MRPLPELTAENRDFWTGGARGELMIAFCDECAAAIHPPQVLCPACGSHGVTTRAMAGTGRVYTFTVNHQQWLPGMQVPFALAVVDVDGAPGVRVTAPVVDDSERVAIGQRVRINFEQAEDVWLPSWRLTDEEPG